MLASTLTTVAVFLPLVFVQGIAGQLFKDQALTITYSLLASLVVALTFVPMALALSGFAPPPPREASSTLPAPSSRWGAFMADVVRVGRFLFIDVASVLLFLRFETDTHGPAERREIDRALFIDAQCLRAGSRPPHAPSLGGPDP